MQEMLKNIKNNKYLSYLEQKNKQAETFLINCLNNGTFSNFIMLGLDSRIPNEDEALSIGNVGFILNTIYRCHSKYPDRNINEQFENELIDMLGSNFYRFYAAMDIIDLQLKNESSGKAPFIIKNEKVFIALKEGILKHYSYINGNKIYIGQNFENGLSGYIQELNEYTEKRGHRIL